MQSSELILESSDHGFLLLFQGQPFIFWGKGNCVYDFHQVFFCQSNFSIPSGPCSSLFLSLAFNKVTSMFRTTQGVDTLHIQTLHTHILLLLLLHTLFSIHAMSFCLLGGIQRGGRLGSRTYSVIHTWF